MEWHIRHNPFKAALIRDDGQYKIVKYGKYFRVYESVKPFIFGNHCLFLNGRPRKFNRLKEALSALNEHLHPKTKHCKHKDIHCLEDEDCNDCLHHTLKA